MGSRALAITMVLAAMVYSHEAKAQRPAGAPPAPGNPCRSLTASGSPFAVCFDPGNRVHLDAGFTGASPADTTPDNSTATNISGSLGVGLDIRHRVVTDDPDVSWRLEHAIAHATVTGDRLVGTLYSGRYLRHAVDGHLLLPLSPPRKLFVPFDIGMEAEVGRLDRATDASDFELGVIRAAILFEFVRTSSFRRRLAIGPVVRWDMTVTGDASAIDRHTVTPFSTGLVDGYVESRNGLSRAHVRVMAGTAWATTGQWQTQVDARATLERVLFAINDRPLSLYTRIGYSNHPTPASTDGSDTWHWRATVGARLAWSWSRPDRGR